MLNGDFAVTFNKETDEANEHNTREPDFSIWPENICPEVDEEYGINEDGQI